MRQINVQKKGSQGPILMYLALCIGFISIWTARCMGCDVASHILGSHEDEVNSVAFNPQGNLIATGSSDKLVKLWDLRAKTLRHSLMGHTQKVTTVQFDRTGEILGSASDDGIIKLWNPFKGRFKKNIQSKNGRLSLFAFCPTQDLLAAGNDEHTVELWNHITGLLVSTLDDLLNPPNALAWSDDGNYLAYISDYARISVYSTHSQKLKQWDLQGGAICALAFIPSGNYLAAKTTDYIILLNSSDGSCLRKIFDNYESFSSEFQTITSDRSGAILVSHTGSQITLWNQHSGRLLQTLTGHTDTIFTVAFNKAGTILASGSSDKTIRLWKKEYPIQQMLSLLLALHARCGSQSSARFLPLHIFQQICGIFAENSSFLDPTHHDNGLPRLIKSCQFLKTRCGMLCAMSPTVLLMMLIAITMVGKPMV